MTVEEFRHHMESYRQSFNKEAIRFNDSYVVLDRLHTLYEGLDVEERAMADAVLSEWVQSYDENLRFDGLALIDDFKIVTAIPALRKLAGRLALSTAPGATDEWEKVTRLIAELSQIHSQM